MTWPIVGLILGSFALSLAFTYAVFRARLRADAVEREWKTRNEFVQKIIHAGVASALPPKQPPAKETVQ